jgi:hypothetical protein
MDLIGFQGQYIDIILAQFFQVFDILRADDMAFLESAAFVASPDNFRDVMGEDHTDRMFDGDCFEHI